MDTTIRAADGWPPELDGAESADGDRGIWKSTVAAASQAIEAAKGMHQTVGQTLKLQRKILALREELHRAEAERDLYRDLHARTVDELNQTLDLSPAEWQRLRAESETLQIRHRAYKLLVQHYARTGAVIEPALFADQRSRVQQHILFQRRKGIPVAVITVDDIAFLLR
ncbi:hypothetical protein [Cupriavidus plantarum]|uniref:Uncharacterized protein n=1 Tax=Cupriavidus plantarum TaxID=942865 RepID=A0A316F697_9BURK|nr:hypothetical protein [Cupriavidus plantarum]NYH97392.1 uncharacterized small protein (DUF1192 family) [Cupriavidus plantarum]PWK38999.1 hypothetical protein C7419_1012902 [Cupriavidus plantarum]REE92673.1 hypothetical protein C7418_3943 [Cupriavidus plantarum]RLK36190.1 hypothetical protein C7417_3968 [Cupriavidus plantarum]